MKSKLLTFLLFSCLFAILFSLTIAKAAVGDPYSYEELILSTNKVAASTDTTVTSEPFLIRGNIGFAILPYFSIASASTANIVFRFKLSADGTNYTTTEPLTATIAANGTNAVRGYANFGPSTLNNVMWAKLSSVNNGATNTLSISNVVKSVYNR